MKAAIISLGCPKNLTDSEVLMGKLSCSGYEIIEDPKKADLIVINTCAFLKASRDEAYSVIKQANKIKKKDAKIYIAGCLPKLLGKQANTLTSQQADGIIESIDLFDSHTPRIKATNPWTAFVKVSEGCNNRCAYCLIPTIRGRLKNRPIEDIIEEVKSLANRGVKEIIYVAQDTTAHPDFPALLHKTALIDGIHWIRAMYTHPAHVTTELINVMQNDEKVVKYIDLPIQHICDKILKGMKRKVFRKDIINLIGNLRTKIPGLTIRTSIIVGFPGETKKDFDELVDFLEGVKLERLGVFKFSREEGTPASKMRGQVPEKVKNSRFHKLMALQKRISRERNKKMVGSVIEVLIERQLSGYSIGRASFDAPEIDGSVKVLGSAHKVGEFVSARVTKALDYDLVANAIT